MKFTNVHAQFVRRDDGLEVEFMSRHELRYSLGTVNYMLFIERAVAGNGTPDGNYVYLNDQKLSPEETATVRENLEAAAIPLRTKFHF